MFDPRQISSRFPESFAVSVRWSPVCGGFSGSAVWRGDDSSGHPFLALKLWPQTMSAERLGHIHQWMKLAAELPFAPRVLRAAHGGTVLVDTNRIWDLTTWMPGVALSDANGSLKPACAALARLHHAWRPGVPQVQPVPGVLRRLAILDDPSGLSSFLSRFIEPARNALIPWVARPLPVQPCLCDVHRDHILFANGDVTGIIDYGAMKLDHVVVDLARYLGDMCGEDDAAFESGLEAYCGAGGIPGVPSTFVRALDRSGLVCALIGWERRLNGFSSPIRAVTDRIERLRARLASLPGI